MEINISRFAKTSVIDTCAIWHILSSTKLVSAVKASNAHFAATAFVYYEALYKPRSAPTREDIELQQKLREERLLGFFGDCSIDISDLQEVGILEKRKRLGKGELSSIAFAKKTGLAFMTDDQKARKLGKSIIGKDQIQTTPHLFGWLFYMGYLESSDKLDIINQHESHGGKLRQYFEEAYKEAKRYLIMDGKPDKLS
ncbi:hypothetical protein [Methylomagnum sp.]